MKPFADWKNLLDDHLTKLKETQTNDEFVNIYETAFEDLKDFSFDLMSSNVPTEVLEEFDAAIDIMERDIDYGAAGSNRNYLPFTFVSSIFNSYKLI